MERIVQGLLFCVPLAGLLLAAAAERMGGRHG